MNKKGTLILIKAMRQKAESDIRRYSNVANNNGDYVGKKSYESALYFLNVEFPVIKEIISESFKES